MFYIYILDIFINIFTEYLSVENQETLEGFIPETKNIGAKAQSVVAIVVRTGRHTWYVPSIAACSGDFPSCQRA